MTAPASATVTHLLAGTVKRLRAAGVEDAAREARRILEAAAGITAEDLLRDPGRTLPTETLDRIGEVAARRAVGEPLSRIVGFRNFYGRDFLIGQETLDPRPDTEVVVETAIAILTDIRKRNPNPRILDLGTGTGCIAITLLLEVGGVHGVATDISPEALEVARANARALAPSGRLDFVLADGPFAIEGPFDLVVSNPPYIPSGDIAALDENVRAFDPVRALDGGPDGLALYRAWIPDIERRFPSAAVVFEVGAGQAGEVSELLRAAHYGRGIVDRRDLGGHVRCVATASVNP